MSEYHVDKYAIEITNDKTGETVRFMEIFGKNAAEATLAGVCVYWSARGGHTPSMKQIRNAKGSME